jgi:hypothetical protein
MKPSSLIRYKLIILLTDFIEKANEIEEKSIEERDIILFF